MWRDSLLSAPLLGLALFYLLSFELALTLYVVGVCLVFWLYDWLVSRHFRTH